MYYVYELVNLLGTVEYVGQTEDPKGRFSRHTKNKLSMGRGKFFGRQDISMHLVSFYPTRAEALQAEYDLQIFWGLPTDTSSRGSKLTDKQVREIKSLLAKDLSCAEVARRFFVSRRLVNFIKQGRRWAHVK